MMMKFIFLFVFLIPLNFLGYFWFIQWVYWVSIFMFLLNLNLENDFSNISYMFGIDKLSYLMILLSLWICVLMFLASEKIYRNKNYIGMFMLLMNLLLLSLLFVFCSMNLFYFYLFFEISLIPVLILIIGWGYQPERIEAGIYLLFYTMMFSLPMMISLFYYYSYYYSLDMNFMVMNLNIYLYLCMNLVFMVKMPMFLIHLWLPKAHVEAPVAGSMILAGVMLKLGGYGLMRVLSLFMLTGLYFNFFFIIISMVGGIIVSLICLRQSDMKSLIAYSSVAHMGLVLSGILTCSSFGYLGAFVMMIGHGLCSSGLFCLANIIYERVGSRSLYLSKGMMNIFPNLSMWWFLLSVSNMAAPPSLNLVGEIILINSLMSYSKMMFYCLIFLSFFSAVYSLFLYSFSQHGKLVMSLYSFYNISIREYILLMLHWFPLNVLLLKSDLFL
uniref:NADH-ubiquinone oxidoreductase chain 4 n=1 Tax=Anthribidae sp. 9 ACP-2013 TaxID=1434436 RepID=A0A3G5FNW4_9CUCU|nr:NADH dehydrogenase subunit 4 [Anthribidae sp. 9 ACP-2013]